MECLCPKDEPSSFNLFCSRAKFSSLNRKIVNIGMDAIFFGYILAKLYLNSMILDVFQQPKQWPIEKCRRFLILSRI